VGRSPRARLAVAFFIFTLALGSTAAPVVRVASAAGAVGNASINLTKSIAGVSVTPTLGLGLFAETALTYTPATRNLPTTKMIGGTVLALLLLSATALGNIVADLMDRPTVGDDQRNPPRPDPNKKPNPDSFVDPAPPIAPPQAPPTDDDWDGRTLYRVWGGPAPAYPEMGTVSPQFGRFWSTVDPRIFGPDRYRVEAGLPDKINAGTFLSIGTLRDETCIVALVPAAEVGPSTTFDGQFPDGVAYGEYPGGIIEAQLARPVEACFATMTTEPLSPPYGGRP
jgi:hypothetical protein